MWGRKGVSVLGVIGGVGDVGKSVWGECGGHGEVGKSALGCEEKCVGNCGGSPYTLLHLSAHPPHSPETSSHTLIQHLSPHTHLTRLSTISHTHLTPFPTAFLTSPIPLTHTHLT